MRGDPGSMTVLSPRTPAQAVRALAKNPGALPLAGGTDVMVGWNMGLLNGRTVVNLCAVAAWKKIAVSKGSVRIGALVTHSQIQRHPVVRSRFPLLVQACATVGAAQIQNRGTLGGNVANASPAGDSFPPLAAYDALVLCVGPDGRRAVPIHEIFAGVKKTTLGPGELIEAIELPFPPKPPTRAVFRKVGTRAAQSISKTMFAGLLWLRKDGTVAEARLAFGSLAPTVRRLRAAESFLKDRPLDAAAAGGAAALLADDVSPIDDVRSTRDYRLEASRNLLVRFLEGAPR
ncbi:MAG TPA: xanthine dehydrogenase family protein subunit M [Elusimicrobiota bacterium]|nr:xanthine dehydrogenase family protein subunit M [Elusimicrobiota bacterium]